MKRIPHQRSLRHRECRGKERTECVQGGTRRRAPAEALERKAEAEVRLHRGICIPREEGQATFATYYERWLPGRHVAETRAFTDAQRAQQADRDL